MKKTENTYSNSKKGDESMVKKGEMVFFGWVILLLLTVFSVQILFLFPEQSSVFLNQSAQEGGREGKPPRMTALISFESRQSEPGVFLTVNGKRRENFYNKKITISVQENSIIVLDAQGVNHPVRVEITGVSDFVNRKNLRMKWEGKGKKILIGQILFQ